MDFGRIITSDGNEIEITKDMLEDFSVLSLIYKVSIKELIRNLFDCEFEDSAGIQTLNRKAG